MSMTVRLKALAVLFVAAFALGCGSGDSGEFDEGKVDNLSPEHKQQLDQSSAVQDPEDAVIEKPMPAPDGE